MEMLALAAPLALFVVAALLTARTIRRLRPGWRRWWIGLLAALPLPAIGVAAGVALFARIEATLPPRACGMPLLGPVMLVLYSLVGFVVAGAACRVYLARA